MIKCDLTPVTEAACVLGQWCLNAKQTKFWKLKQLLHIEYVACHVFQVSKYYELENRLYFMHSSISDILRMCNNEQPLLHSHPEQKHHTFLCHDNWAQYTFWQQSYVVHIVSMHILFFMIHLLLSRPNAFIQAFLYVELHTTYTKGLIIHRNLTKVLKFEEAKQFLGYWIWNLNLLTAVIHKIKNYLGYSISMAFLSSFDKLLKILFFKKMLMILR